MFQKGYLLCVTTCDANDDNFETKTIGGLTQQSVDFYVDLLKLLSDDHSPILSSENVEIYQERYSRLFITQLYALIEKHGDEFKEFLPAATYEYFMRVDHSPVSQFNVVSDIIKRKLLGYNNSDYTHHLFRHVQEVKTYDIPFDIQDEILISNL